MRPFRFGLVYRGETSPVDIARRAEDAGYSTLLFPDHTRMLSPLPAMAAAATVTSRLRLGTQVVNIAFRPLGALAQDVATVDAISGGRVELGLGAGYAEPEVRSLGLPFGTSRERIDEVERALSVLPRLFAGETVTEPPGPWRLDEYSLQPCPPQGASVPLMVGGNGDRILSVAARAADIVQFTGFISPPGTSFRHFTLDGLADRVAHVRAAAGERFPQLELSLLVQQAAVGADRDEIMRPWVDEGVLPADQAATTPFVLTGSADAICERLLELRERFGISYISVFDFRSDGFDEIVGRLAGR
ncbi:MAG TPA: TIGR03621 family F420-dependent LLM class oxidoreductase [Micromonosporaceae bacterium]